MIAVDVVIPVRDVDRYLADAIDSLLAQSGTDVRVTVVDAGSARPVVLTDRHAGHPAVRLLRSDAPLRAGGARNLGAAAGDRAWLAFLDGDDLAVGESLALLGAAAASQGADLAVGRMTSFPSGDDAAGLRIPPGEPVAYVPGGVLVARAAWDAVGPFDAELRTGEFVDWIARFRARGLRAVEVPEVVLRRRLHRDSTTARQLAGGDRDDYLKVVRAWLTRTGS